MSHADQTIYIVYAMIKNYYTFPQHDDFTPKSIVLLLHGLGSNGQDLISLAPLWAKDLPDTLFISPDAPFACDMVPPGYPNAYQWFSLQDRAPEKIKAGIEIAQPLLNEFIDQISDQYQLSANKIALVGFSQGTMMSLYVGPRYKDKIAGVLGYSGALFGENDLENTHKFPVCLVHGDADDVVPVAAYHHARPTLEKAGFTLSGHTTPGLPHSIAAAGIEAGRQCLCSGLL